MSLGKPWEVNETLLCYLWGTDSYIDLKNMLIIFVCVNNFHLCPTLCDPWIVARQAPLSMGFSRQEYWSCLPFPPPRDLPKPGIKPRSSALQADSLPSELPWQLKQLIIWYILNVGIPTLWDLMPEDLRWSWCHNNRNQVHNQCNVLESSQHHPKPPPSSICGKTVLHETGPWCQKRLGIAALQKYRKRIIWMSFPKNVIKNSLSRVFENGMQKWQNDVPRQSPLRTTPLNQPYYHPNWPEFRNSVSEHFPLICQLFTTCLQIS